MSVLTRFVGSAPTRQRVAVLACDGVVLGDLSIPCEIFHRARSAGGQPLYDVRVCGPASHARSAHVGLHVPWRLPSLVAADTVVVPGYETSALPAVAIRALVRAAARGARMVSICSGAFVLAEAGLLDGRRATTHWRAAAALAARYPLVEVDPNVLFVDEGDVLTSAGALAGADLCLHLVRVDHGAEVAAAVARASVMPLEREGGQAQYIEHVAPSPDGTSLVSLLGWLEANLDRELDLPAMARRSGTSTRTLSRRFAEQTGMTPAKWLARARVRRAQQLLETTRLSIDRVAETCGFRSATVLRAQFRARLGTTPTAYRRAFSRASNRPRAEAR